MKEASQRPLGVVFSGGGMRCAYAIGVLRALEESHGIHPFAIAAISGSVAPVVFHLAKRYEEMRQWPDLIDDKNFISYRRRRPIDIEYVCDVFMSQAPDIGEAVGRNPVRCFLAATRSADDTTHWFTNEDFQKHPREILKATQGLSHAISVGGETYLDGCYSTSHADCVRKVRDAGAERVLIVDNCVASASHLTPYFLWFQAAGTEARRLAWKFRQIEPSIAAQSPDLLVCRRREDLAVRHPLDNDPERYRRTIDQGYEDCAALSF